MPRPRIDVEFLLIEPDSAFEAPIDVVAQEGLTIQQKRDVLGAWKARTIVKVKSGEISDAKAKRTLQRIDRALKKLLMRSFD